MALNLEATTSWSHFAASGTKAFTVPTGLSNSVLLYFYESETRSGFSNLDVGSVQWNDVNLALLDIITDTEGGGSAVEVWYLANPDAGALTFEWGNATVSSNTRQGLAVYSGADQSIPTNITEILDPDDPSGTLTGTTSGNLVIGAFGASGSDMDTSTQGASQTRVLFISDRPGTGGYGLMAVSHKAAGGDITMSENNAGTGGSGGYILFELKAAAGTTTKLLPLLGVGT